MPNLRGKTWTTTTPANVEDAQYWEDHLISDTAALKAASSVQSVNSITPDAQGNVNVVALPAGGTAGQVLTKQSSTTGDADWEDPASSGHTIEDEDGNTMPYQSTLQFTNAEVTNDTVNSKTVVDCKGAKGDAATIAVGTVTTLPAGSDATVTNAGTSSAAVFNFGIPKGQDGSGAVDSVNGKTGVVVLGASDVGALPDSTTIPTKTSDLDNDSGFVTSSAIPTSLSELSDDTTHRLVTDAEKTAWDAKVSESLLKDTVGWVGKNLLPIKFDDVKVLNSASGTWSGNVYTRDGVTYTFDVVNGYVTNVYTNGTANSRINLILGYATPRAGSYIVSKGYDTTQTMHLRIVAEAYNDNTWVKVLASSTTDDDTALSVDYDGYNRVRFALTCDSGDVISNLAVYPMLRDTSITDSTFEPYHKPVSDVITDVYGIMGENGAKNKLPLSLEGIKSLNSARTWVGNSCEHNGRTFTVNTDSNGNVTSISSTGTTTGFAFLRLCSVASKSGNFKLNGGVSDEAICYIQNETTSTLVASSNGADVPVTLSPTANVVNCIVGVQRGVSTDATFYPMLRDARDTDSTYQPYAMTNRELTDELTTKEGSITTNFTFGNVHTVRKYGKVVELNLQLTGIEDVTAYSTAIAQISAGFRPNADIQPVSFLKVGSEKVVRGYIKRSTGEVQLQENVGSGANAEFRVFATWITS